MKSMENGSHDWLACYLKNVWQQRDYMWIDISSVWGIGREKEHDTN